MDYELVKSKIETKSQIDIEKLRSECERLGPLRISRENYPYSVELSVDPCLCHEECGEDVVSVWRRNGLFVIHWLLTPDELTEFDTLDDFFNWIVAGGIEDSRGERLIVEVSTFDVLGKRYSEVPQTPPCFCQNCLDSGEKEEIWQRLLLYQLAMQLMQRDEILSHAAEHYGEEGKDFAQQVFDAGFAFGRTFSEFKVKHFIEPYATAGQAHEEATQKRAARAGESSAQRREKRRKHFWGHVVRLLNENPAMARTGVETVATIAAEDAAQEDPLLWSQGAGQVIDYIGEIRRGEAGKEAQDVYRQLFG